MLLIVGLVAAASISIGCRTVTQADGSSVRIVDTNKVDKAAVIIRNLVTDGAAVGIAQEPGAAPYLRLTSAVLREAAAKGTTDPVGLRKAIAALPVKELNQPWAKIAVANAIGAYEVFYQDQLANAIGGNYAAAKILAAVADGIDAALGPPQAKQDELRQIVREEIRAALFTPRGGIDRMPIMGEQLVIPAGPFNTQVPYVVTTEDRRFYGGTNALMPQQSITWR